MVNLLGTSTAPIRAAHVTEPRSYVHLYGKEENRPGRKMGHVTAVGSDVDEALARAKAAAASIEL
jgi:5-(carboxyamino)imidazole ribonucleotide synthase